MARTQKAQAEPKLPDDYPLFDVTDVDLAFSTASGHVDSGGRYLDFYSGQTALVPRQYVNIASDLFFKGGTPFEHGLMPRASLGDPEEIGPRIMRALRYLLTSWAPKHQEKEATVGFALMMWCEPIPVDAEESA